MLISIIWFGIEFDFLLFLFFFLIRRLKAAFHTYEGNSLRTAGVELISKVCPICPGWPPFFRSLFTLRLWLDLNMSAEGDMELLELFFLTFKIWFSSWSSATFKFKVSTPFSKTLTLSSNVSTRFINSFFENFSKPNLALFYICKILQISKLIQILLPTFGGFLPTKCGLSMHIQELSVFLG